MSKEKEIYIKAQVLLSTNNPSNTIGAIMLLHRIIYTIKGDGTEERAFWKGLAAVELGNIFLAGVNSCDYEGEDGYFYTNCYVKADLLKAYDLYHRAMKYGCFDGVKTIGEIYMLLGEYDNAAEMFQAVIEYGYKDAEDAKKALQVLLESGKIDRAPTHVAAPTYEPSFSFIAPE